MGDLADWAADLSRRADDLTPVQHAMGQAARRVVTDSATRSLGSDLRFITRPSGTRVRLGAGYDLDREGLYLKMRPAGLWRLADRGQRREVTIVPRRRRKSQSTKGDYPTRLAFGGGFRASAVSRAGRFPGWGTLERARLELDNEVTKAVDAAMLDQLGG